MKRFKNIIYIVGPDLEEEHAISEKVRSLADLNDARITVVRVEEESYIEQVSRALSEQIETLARMVKKQSQDELHRFVSSDFWQGIDISVGTLPSGGFIGVIQKVLQDNHDLVIKGAPLTDGVDQLAMRLIRKCPCPVWIIRQDHSGDFRRILAAVDVEADEAESTPLNIKILELAHSLAQREQGEAHCLHAWRLEYEMMLRGPRFKISPEELFELKDSLHGDRLNGLQHLLESSKLHFTEQNIHLVEGETVEVLRNFLDEYRVDVLVMGSIARSGIPGLLIGNMAEKVLQTVKCTVLVVKPDGFISPVTL